MQNYQVIFDMDSMRVGFVGDFKDKTAPLEVMDALTYGVSSLLAATIIFVACQMTLKDSDEIEQEQDNQEQIQSEARSVAVNDDYVRVDGRRHSMP